MGRTSRREFLKSSVTAAACAASGGGVSTGLLSAPPSDAARNTRPASPSSSVLAIKKGLVYSMLPNTLSHADRFKLAGDAGFAVVQAPTTSDERTAEEIKTAAENAN